MASLFFSRAEEIEEHPTEGGRLLVYRLGPSVLVTRASGRASVDHVQVLIRRSDELIARVGTISVVHDWFEVVAYAPEVRQLMTPWAFSTRKQHLGVHIGTDTGLVRMGVTMVRIATGAPIHAYERPGDLEIALGAILASPREVSL